MAVKTRYWVAAFLVTGLLAVGLLVVLVQRMLPPPATAADLDPAHAAIASDFVDRLDGGEFAAAHGMLAATAAAAIAPEQLEELWTALPSRFGTRRERGAVRGEQVAGRAVATITLAHERLPLDARIIVDADGRIDGFRLVPARVPTEPEPALPAGIVERAVVVGARALPGTLSLPAGAGTVPAVVLVHGSGPHDRDQTIGPNRVFRDLAHGLNARGIAVLRYEKRTLAEPQGFGEGSRFTVDDETVDDAVAALALLRRQPGVDPSAVHLLGHSLGAMMAPRIAQRAEAVAGVIMLAAPARPLHDVVPAQVAYLADLDGNRSEAESRALAETEAAAARVRELGTQDPDGGLLLGLPAAYWRDLLGYDPVTVAATLPQPLLLLHGGRDYQVTDEDFERWRVRFDGDPRVALKRYPALNHLFMAGSGTAGPDEYFRAGSFDDEPIADIADWIHGR